MCVLLENQSMRHSLGGTLRATHSIIFGKLNTLLLLCDEGHERRFTLRHDLHAIDDDQMLVCEA